jgi:hypothetical protein
VSISVAAWISRLENQVQEAHNVRAIGAAADLASVQPNTRTTPSIFVIPATAAAEPNRMDTVNRQRVTLTMSVILAISNYRDQGAANTDLDGLWGAVQAALILWEPSSGYSPVEYEGGNLFQYDDSTLWWADRYVTRFHLSVQEPAA